MLYCYYWLKDEKKIKITGLCFINRRMGLKQTLASLSKVSLDKYTFKWRSRVERNLTLSAASTWCLLSIFRTNCKFSLSPDSASFSTAKTFFTNGSFICSWRALKVAFLSRHRSISASGPFPCRWQQSRQDIWTLQATERKLWPRWHLLNLLFQYPQRIKQGCFGSTST